ncbi:MAG TPA: putative sulfate exporter family transporter, partial [Roseovarius nubinhibens]|nr:putative sulfate exporter family transporter [Roseovarius nubinhibens]
IKEASRWFLVIAISALGMKTNLATIVGVKPSYGAILVIETLFLLGIALGYVMWIGL